tara:strand:+ start:242 stop:637 length:396 start_codon:yes stop_codon:yes gene_type:complete
MFDAKIENLEINKSLVYFVAISRSQKIIGKCGFNIVDEKTIIFQDIELQKEYSNQELYRKLFNESFRCIRKKYPNHIIETYSNDENLSIFLRHDFIVTKKLPSCKKLVMDSYYTDDDFSYEDDDFSIVDNV